MAYLIEHLAKHGVNEVVVNISYLHKKFSNTLVMGIALVFRLAISLKVISAMATLSLTWVGQDYSFEEMIVCGEYCVDRHGRMMHVDDEACHLIWSDAREKVVYPMNYAHARL